MRENVGNGFTDVPLFAGCTRDELAALASGARRRRHRRGECIFREGDPETSLCLVERGWVKRRVESPEGRERILGFLGPGEVFGELSVLDGQSWTADVVAQEDCVVVYLTREAVASVMQHHPEATLRLLQLLGRRLRTADLQIRDGAFLDVRGRLARVLLELGQDGERPGGPVLHPHLRQEELAHVIGATRESVNRWLGWFERIGAIRRSKDRITLLDRDRLRRQLE
jgi:CRP/FNR family transcriptional regulator